MELGDHEWRRWPLPGAGAASALEHDAPAKEASAPPDLSVEGVAGRMVGSVREWVPEFPPGLMKSAALRDEGGELPEVTQDNLWRHPNASPAVLLIVLLDHYGQEMLDWDPEVLLETLKRDGRDLSNSTKVKILAARVVLNSPSPWRQWEVFHWVGLGLDGQPPNFTYMEDPELGHMVLVWDLMKMLDPARDTSDEVDKFVAATFRKEGIHYIPEPLGWAQRELEDPQIRCEDCDAIHRDDNDVRCVTCGGTQLTKLPYEFADLRDQTKKLWNELKTLPLETALERCPETSVGNAVYRLLVHWDHAKRARANTVQQLRMLGGR